MFSKVKYYFSSFRQYLKYKHISKSNNKVKNDKNLIIDIFQPYYFNRYFYLLLKYFSLSGYSIHIKNWNFSHFNHFYYSRNGKPETQYINLIFEEGLIVFESPSSSLKNVFILDNGRISADYFSPFFMNDADNIKNHWFPITMHPYMYHHDHYDQEVIQPEVRKRSIFLYGNLSSDDYKKFDKGPFKMESRKHLLEHLYKKFTVKKFFSFDDLDSFINSTDVQKFVFFDRQNEFLPMPKLRSILAEFAFFLAPAGVVMPICHNLVEAMSVGCIPIIHSEYALILQPNLLHTKTAIIYDSLDDIDLKISDALNMDQEELKAFRDRVLKYYNDYLSPTQVVNNIVESNFEILRIPSQNRSIRILNESIGV